MDQRREGGFVTTIILVVIGLAALKYFLNWDIFDAAASDEGQSTILYLRNIFNTVWSYVSTPVTFAWNEIIWPLLSLAWDSFQAFVVWGKENADGR